MTPSPLIHFYLNEGTDSEGRTLTEILGWPDRLLESTHDYIQWLFPLRDRSQFNTDAPILSDEDVETFQAQSSLRSNLNFSFGRMLEFYGFEMEETDGVVVISPSAQFKEKAENWLRLRNHNFLRISRILTCLSVLGFKPTAKAFLKALEGIYGDYADIIGNTTYQYWWRAVQ